MQPRFAALLFALGLADLAYVNLGLGRELFSEVEPPAPPAVTPREATPVEEAAPLEQAASVEAEAPVARAQPLEQAAPVSRAEPEAAPAHAPAQPPPAAEIEAAAVEDPAQPAPHAGVARSDTAPRSRPAATRSAEPPRATPKPAARSSPADSPAPGPDLPGSKLTVTFPNTASAWLTGRAREEVLALAAHLRAHPELRLHITGHADARGTREFNLDLGGRRARAVTELLARAGVPREQLEMESRGEDEPRAIGASERVWAANRRVEVHVETGRNEAP